jgi:hypothetical protein
MGIANTHLGGHFRKSNMEPNFRLAFLFGKGQTGITMKTRPQLLILAGAAALALGACATLQLGKGGVSLHATSIEIHPGTNISPQDEQQLYRILGRYKSFLYKINKTENAQVKPRGQLKDVFIEQTLLTEVGKAGGRSHFALQIGTQAPPPDHPQHMHPPPDHPQHMYPPPDHPHKPGLKYHPTKIATVQDYKDMVEMVRKVTPILQKYSRD